jgi:hypothetical protein
MDTCTLVFEMSVTIAIKGQMSLIDGAVFHVSIQRSGAGFQSRAKSQSVLFSQGGYAVRINLQRACEHAKNRLRMDQ